MDRKQKILELARQMGLIRPRDVEAAGIHREYLLRLYRNGDLTRHAAPARDGSQPMRQSLGEP